MKTDELINIISEEQVLALLKKYDLVPLKTKENEFWFRTLCHGGDSNKLCMFRDTKDFFCYTNCGKMSLFELIMHLEDCDFHRAFDIVFYNTVRSTFGNSITEYKQTTQDIQYLERKAQIFTAKINAIPVLPVYDDSILNYFEKDVFFRGWCEEGISIESMEKYQIEWYEREKYIIIPHYDVDGRLVGIRRRSLKPEDAKNKYMPLIIEDKEYGHSLGLNLYGIDKTYGAIKRYKTVCIVESEKSVLLGDTYFGEDNFTVATCGFNISEAQISILAQLGVEQVVLGFDKDFDEVECLMLEENDPKRLGYTRFCNRLYSFCGRLTSRFSVSVLWDREGLLSLKDSPYDKGKDVLEELWKNKVVIDSSLCG